MCVVIVCFPIHDVINFEISFIFFIKQFFYMIFQYLKNENSFKVKQKIFLILFKVLSVAKFFPRPEVAPPKKPL